MTRLSSQSMPKFDSPDAALAAMLPELAIVDAEPVELPEATGRILAEPLVADRDSPPCDVSAMDGYAVRLGDFNNGSMTVEGEATIGRPVATLIANTAMRIFTGGPVPHGAEAVVKREDVHEMPGRITLRLPVSNLKPGQHIRRRGDNVAGGVRVADCGVTVTAAVAGALAAFGIARPRVYRRLRVGVITTGDELRHVGERVEPWEIRNSNGPALRSLLDCAAWIQTVAQTHVKDDRRAIADLLAHLLPDCDAVILTGGVSMGDYDFVPDAIGDTGGRIIFHGIPIRPGKPTLGAVAPAGKAIFALPGNPISVLVTARRIALPGLRHMAGSARSGVSADAMVRIVNPDQDRLHLHWFRPVRRIAADVVELLQNRGSGDLPSAAAADGFVEIPVGQAGAGPFAYYDWQYHG